ncbi:MAG: type IV secretory system conjugative DNA transfer family protein, partial [Alphaproteobacteria bacterium]
MSLSYQRKKDAGETQKARTWIFKAFVWFVSIVYVGTAVSASFFYLVKNGVSKPNLTGLGTYWEAALSPMMFYEFHLNWIANVGAVPNDWRMFGLPVEILITLLPASLLLFYMLVRNPYSFIDDTFGSSRYARDGDIKEMGLLDKGWIIVIGEWKGRLLKLPETLSVLCVAPPGTGKTVSVVVPTILTCDNVSMIVNDVKPELF